MKCGIIRSVKRRTRRILFWLAVISFGIASLVAVRYAQGYQYDFTARRFVRTGAVSVSANTDARLFVDDRLIGPLSFLGNSGGSNRLLPGTHEVRLVRDGWSEWRKETLVIEGRLTEFPHALLLPTDEASLDALRVEASISLSGSRTLKNAPKPTPALRGTTAVAEVSVGRWVLRGDRLLEMDTASGSLIAEHVLGFSPASDGDRVLWWTRNELWVRWDAATGGQPARAPGERLLLSRWTTPIAGAAWFRDFDHVVADLGPSGYRVLETDTRGGVNSIRF